MNLGTITGTSASPGNQRGIGLGYWEAATGGEGPVEDWRGVYLTTDGRLILGRHDADGANRVGLVETIIASGINTGIDHTLSFDIDTSSGDISNIVWDGANQTDITTTIFNANVNYVGMIASSSSPGTFGQFDNFLVAEVPEPSTFALAALSLLGLCTTRRRRRR
jgi:hypothetical protein